MVALKRKNEIARSPNANVSWFGPLPVWAAPGPNGLRIFDEDKVGQPAIFRFDHDDFMQEFLATLSSNPDRMGEWIAQPETWREPMKTPGLTPAKEETSSTVAFLFDKTRRLTQQKKPQPKLSLNAIALRRKENRVPARRDADTPPALKLYQAAQKRHYLVSASLVLNEPGYPDCVPQSRRQEKVTYVLRRLLPPDNDPNRALKDWQEYAFVPGARSKSWQGIGKFGDSSNERLLNAEEQLPLFPAPFSDDCDSGRRLFNAVIPVSRREEYMGTPIGTTSQQNTTEDVVGKHLQRSHASMLFQIDVVAPWKILLEKAAFKSASVVTEDTPNQFDNFTLDKTKRAADVERMLRTTRDEIQTGSWYVLLDFANFLETQLDDVWNALQEPTKESALDPDQLAFVDLLYSIKMPLDLARAITSFPDIYHWRRWGGWSSSIKSPHTRLFKVEWSLAEAIVAAHRANQEDQLERVDNSFTRFDQEGNNLDVDPLWPSFLFPLADAQLDPPLPPVTDDTATLTKLQLQQMAVEQLADAIDALLPSAEIDQRQLDTAPAGDARAGWFVIRCVYQRPQCGPLFTTKISKPSVVFQMAPFFDPDAPSRPVRIPMPMDISPAGLRKYQKNTGFVISDMLCGQIKKMREMTFGDLVLSVLPWPFHKDLPNPGDTGPCKDGSGGFGMVCSLSIPIVTLCALILLMIIVALFDLFFRWIPYLFLCLPIPGLGGKGK